MKECSLTWGGLVLAGCQVTSTPFGLLVDKDLVSFEVPWACVWAPGEAANKGMSLQLSANVEELQKLGVLDNEVAERVGQNTAVMLVESAEEVSKMLPEGRDDDDDDDDGMGTTDRSAPLNLSAGDGGERGNEVVIGCVAEKPTSEAARAEVAQSTGQATVEEEVSKMPDAADMQTTCDAKVNVARDDAAIFPDSDADKRVRQTPDAKKKRVDRVSVTPPPSKKAKTKVLDHQDNIYEVSNRKMQYIVKPQMEHVHYPTSVTSKRCKKALKAAKAELVAETVANCRPQIADLFDKFTKVVWGGRGIGNLQVVANSAASPNAIEAHFASIADDQDEKGRLVQLFKDTVKRQEEQAAARAGRSAGAGSAITMGHLLPQKLFKQELVKVCDKRGGRVTFGAMTRVVLQLVVEELARADAWRLHIEAAKHKRKTVQPKDFEALAAVTLDRFNEAAHKNLLGPHAGIPGFPTTPARLPAATPATSTGPAVALPGTPLPGMPLPGRPLPATPLPALAAPAAPTAGSCLADAAFGEEDIVQDKDTSHSGLSPHHLKNALQSFDPKLKFSLKSRDKFSKLWEAQIRRMSGWCLDAADAGDRATVEIDDTLPATRENETENEGLCTQPVSYENEQRPWRR